MKIKKIIVIVSFILTILSSFAIADEQNNSFTLNTLYKLAVKHSESIKIAEEEIIIAREDEKRAFSALIPDLTVFGSYTTEESDQTVKPVSALSPYSDLSQTTDTTSWGIRIDQSFSLNGKELIALNISKDLIEKSRFDLTALKNEYLYQVASAYYFVLQANKAKEIGNANVKRLEKHKNSVAIRLKLEAVTQTDMYRAESELSDAKSQYIDAENTLKYARATLQSLVSLPDNYILTEPKVNDTDLPIQNLAELQSDGLTTRSEIKSANINHEVSIKKNRYEKSAYWPTISIEGQYAESDLSNDGTYDSLDVKTATDSKSYSIGANLTFTLFDGGLRSADIRKAAARQRQAKLDLNATKKRIRLEIENTYLEVGTQKSKLNALKDKLKYSNQTYKSVSEQFKHGLSNSVDMMDANTLLVSAERELSNAQYQYKLALLKLKKVTGTFSDETGLQ